MVLYSTWTWNLMIESKSRVYIIVKSRITFPLFLCTILYFSLARFHQLISPPWCNKNWGATTFPAGRAFDCRTCSWNRAWIWRGTSGWTEFRWQARRLSGRNWAIAVCDMAMVPKKKGVGNGSWWVQQLSYYGLFFFKEPRNWVGRVVSLDDVPWSGRWKEGVHT